MPETTIPPMQSHVAMPLWDQVKIQIYGYWTKCNDQLAIVDDLRLSMPEADLSVDNAALAFRASVLKLFRACKPKFKYAREFEEVKQLESMKLDRFKTRPAEFDLDLAIEAFDLLTEFIEIDGVTHYEKKVTDPAHALTEELE